MGTQQEKPQQDPAEGSRKVVEHELERTGSAGKEDRKEPRGRPEDLEDEEEGGGPA
jgi:hypothetical protein